MINICCVYYGSKYHRNYVQMLYNMVKRNVTIPFKFICFTDHIKMPKLISGDIEFKIFPRNDMEGWWNKLQLFNPETNLNGINFYLDLDVVILKNIDCFLTWGDDLSFGITNDFGQPNTTLNSSIMKWNNINCSEKIWHNYFNNKPHFRKLHGDQNVITELMRNDKILKPFPDEWTFSYKWYNRDKPRFSKSDWTFEQDPNAKIAVFHGNPNPHESDQQWVKDNWK